MEIVILYEKLRRNDVFFRCHIGCINYSVVISCEQLVSVTDRLLNCYDCEQEGQALKGKNSNVFPPRKLKSSRTNTFWFTAEVPLRFGSISLAWWLVTADSFYKTAEPSLKLFRVA